MTWQRLLNRNRLNTGDYTEVPEGWGTSGGATAWELLEKDSKEQIIAFFKTVQAHRDEEAGRRNKQVMMFAGDLRRLERDALDEGYICREIARRVGADPELVAAVLKEWLAV